MARRALPLLSASLLLALAGCASAVGTGEEAPEASPTRSTVPSDGPLEMPSGTDADGSDETPPADADGIALPTACEQIWTPEGLAVMSEEVGPLNDPTLTMLSTEVVGALEVLDVVETIRCSWGVASEVGIATNVSIVDADQAAAVRRALEDAGHSCEDADGTTRCSFRRELPGEDGPAGAAGETHVLRDDVWIATHWINADYEPDYTDDILAALWG